MRITQRSMVNRSLAGLQGSQARLAVTQQRLATGKMISKPSDDPGSAAAAMQLRGEIARNTQWARNAEDGLSWLGTIDSTLTDMGDSVRKARDLLVEGMSTGSTTAQSREAIATEIESIRDGLLASANTTYLGRPIFGGSTSGTTAYDASGAYVGDTTIVARNVGTNTTVRVDVTGPEAFGASGANLFAVLSQIASDLRTATSGLSADLTALDGVTHTMTTQLADVGARYNRIDHAATVAANRKDDLTGTLTSIEDIDLARTIVDLNLQQTTYEAALQATAKVIQPSLMDFLS